MVDTVRTISALQTLLADNASGDISAQDVRDMLVTLAPKYAELTDTGDQDIAVVDTPQTVDFDTEDVLNGFTHSGGVVTASEDMEAIEIVFEGEVNNGGGANTLMLWIEVDTGGGFAAVANSGEQVIISANTEMIVILDRIIQTVSTGDDFRIRMEGSSTNLSLNAIAADSPIPAIPSAVLSIKKL
ncbi:MAG: hypothetical protein COB36_12320 [Alphaproteobacteria bacterium]|nr:MAG: hypothetical protein COB36_12320 [Alphaproteobacteria bacterium]